MKKISRAGVFIGLVLAVSVIPVQSASAVIHPDSTALTASTTDSSISYGVLSYSCNTATFKGSTGVSASSISGTLSLSNSPAGCSSNVGVTCTVTAGALTITMVTSVATGGTATFTTGSAITFNCGSGFCVITVPAQGPRSSATYVNATGNLNVSITTLTATRTGSGGALCGPASGSMSLKATFTISPKITVV